MSRTVICRKYGREMTGLDVAPMPGPVGEDIYNNISAQAWQEWQDLQTMLINEHHLSLRDASSRQYLNDQRKRFFDNEEPDRPSGYVPEED